MKKLLPLLLFALLAPGSWLLTPSSAQPLPATLAGNNRMTGTNTFSGNLTVSPTGNFTATSILSGNLTANTTLPNLWSLTFNVEQQKNWFGLVDDDFSLVEINGLADPLVQTVVSVSAVAADGQDVNVTPSGSGYGVWSWYTQNLYPALAIQGIVDATRSGSSAQTVNVGWSIYAGNYVLAIYDQVAGKAYMEYHAGGSTVDTTSISVAATTTASTTATFGLTLIGPYANLWWQTPGTAYPQIIQTATISGTLDLTVPANVAALQPEYGGSYSGGSGAVKWRKVYAGYAKGSGLANLSRVVWPDSTPVCSDGHIYYMVANRGHPEINTDFTSAVRSMQCGLYSWDSNTNEVKCVANFAFNRSGHLYGENSGCMMVNWDGTCELLVPSWGSYPADVRIYRYHLATFPAGNMVLSGGTALTLPDDAAGINDYDPDLNYNAVTGTWTMVYSHGVTSGGYYYPYVVTSTDFSTWTATAKYATTTAHLEGNKLINWGGTLYVACISNDTYYWPVLDLATLTVQGTITNPLGHVALPPLGSYGFNDQHPNIFPVLMADGTTQMRAVIWNVASYPGTGTTYGQPFFGGQVITLRSPTVINGTVTGTAIRNLQNK